MPRTQEIFKRTPERQKDYEKALELFAQGKVAAEVARLLKLPYQTCRYWASEIQRKNKIRRQKTLSVLGGVKNASEVATSQLPEVAVPLVNSRGKIEGIYYKSIESLDKTITLIYKTICEGRKKLVVEETGEEMDVSLTVSDYKELVQTLSLCIKEFTSLNLLPYGSQSPSGSVVKDKVQTSQQHIHLHGGALSMPQKPRKAVENKQVAETLTILEAEAEPVSVIENDNNSEVLDEL